MEKVQRLDGYGLEKLSGFYDSLRYSLLPPERVLHRSNGFPIQIDFYYECVNTMTPIGNDWLSMVFRCMISHGASAFLKERLLDQSDSYTTCVCKLCGMTAIQDVLNNTSYCKGCKTSDVAEVTIPYAYKLLAQELQAANIVARMNVE